MIRIIVGITNIVSTIINVIYNSGLMVLLIGEHYLLLLSEAIIMLLKLVVV